MASIFLCGPVVTMMLSCATARTESPLIRKLLDPATRMRALYELEDGQEDQSFAEFAEEHANLQVTRCPQRGSAPPLYVVSHDPEWRSSRLVMSGDYDISKPDELFQTQRPASGTGGKGPTRLMDQSLDGFHEDGRSFSPFDGHNMITDGYLADINGDGLIEKLDTYNTGVSGSNDKVEVLAIRTAEMKSRSLLTVVLNWHASDADIPENRWSWDIRQGAGKTWQVVLFPSTGGTDKPGAVYEWDAAQKRFTGPAGGKGSHFVRLSDDLPTWQPALEKLRDQGGLDYAVVRPPAEPREGMGPAYGPPVVAPPPARPYVKQSRKALTNAEVFAFMGPGRSLYDHVREHQTHDRVPDGFWNMAPHAAALELVNLNRSERHRALFQLDVEDRDGQKPPETGTLHLSHSSSGCYNARQWEILISFHPGDSWVAYARAVENGAATRNALHDGTYYDFEWHELKDADARHLAHTIWWLDRMRSRDRRKDHGGMSLTMSTADGFAELKLQASASDKALVDLDGTVFSSDVRHRWDSDYNKETALNFACLLIEKELPPRWGGGRDFLHDAMPVLRGDQDTPPDPMASEKRRQGVRMMLERFLERLDKQPSLKPVFLQRALHAAGEIGVPVEDVAKTLETHMRPPTKMEIELRELEERIKAAGPRSLPALPAAPPIGDDPFGSDDPPTPKPRRESDDELRARKLAQQQLDDDLRAYKLRRELEDDLSFMLRGTLPTVRRQLAARDDVAALKAWAAAGEPGAAWAMRRLQELDMTAYVDVLSTDLLKLTSPGDASKAVVLFKELCETDTAAATRALAQMKGEPGKSCAVIAPPGISAGKTDVGRLLTLLADKKTYSDKQGVIDQLVPPDEPMRHRDPRIEKALLKEMQEQAGEFAGTGRTAAEALTRREGAIQHWNAFKRFYEKEVALYLNAHDFLCRVALDSGDPRHLAELRAMLLPRLQRTNSALRPVFAAIYVLDLRDTASDLERVSTFDATDVEGKEAHSAGGGEHAVRDRFHMPRQTLALWDEPDATTTARMLVAWSVHHASDKGMFLDRVRAQTQAALAVPSIDHAVVREFLDWCLGSANAALDSPMSAATRQMLESWRKSLP
jgi:hypothetical protein